MRRRKKSSDGDEAEVPLSPLIDCVFLMLIFFLVTSMIKRWERQIPTRMQQDATVIEKGESSAELEIGINTQGQPFTIRGRTKAGLNSKPAGNLPEYLRELGESIDKNIPITLIVEEQTDFQTFVRVLDEFEIQGFAKVRARASDIRFAGTRERKEIK